MAMMSTDIEDYYNNPRAIKSFVDNFIGKHGFTGVHIPNLAAQLFNINSKSDTYGTEIDGRQGNNPDPRAFKALEDIITAVHKAGGVVHIWPWGDSARGQTPDQLPGGENGAVHDRIIEYMADRLGPLPGWTLGYGFDNFEWTTPQQAAQAARYFDQQSGYEHLSGIRGGASVRRDTDHSKETKWHKAGQDFADYEHHEPGYQAYVKAFQASNGLPVQSGDRFRIRGEDGPGKDFTAEQTIDTLWISTMAGGASGIYGNLTRSNGKEINSNEGSLSYSSAIQAQIKTWNKFFIENDRFELDSTRANHLTGGPSKKQYALESKSKDHVVVYAEDTNVVTLNLGKLSGDKDWKGGAKVIAVNTEAGYREIDLGNVSLTNQTVKLPKKGDWAVFVEARDGGGNSSGGNGGGNNGGNNGGGQQGNRAPDANYDRVNTFEGKRFKIDVLKNDTDPDGNVLKVISVGSPSKGNVWINDTGDVVYRAPNDFTGRDTFTYTISDGKGGRDTARVDVQVKESSNSGGGGTGGGSQPGNRAPDARYDRVSIEEGKRFKVDVLKNDRDADGNPLKITAVSSAAEGNVYINNTGDIVYRAPTKFTGRDSFTYTISDGKGGKDTARVDVDVNKAKGGSNSGGNNNGGGSNTPPAQSEGPVYTMSRASFDGKSRDIKDITLSDDFTIMGSVWFKNGKPINQRDALAGDGSYRDGNDLNFYNGKFRLYSSDASPRDVVVAETKARPGQEAHYAITRKDGITKLYVNGELEDVSNKKWTGDFVVGEIGGGVQSTGLGGRISDFAVYERALSSKDVSKAAAFSTSTSKEIKGTSSNAQAKIAEPQEQPAKEDKVDNAPAPSKAGAINADAAYTLSGETEVSVKSSVVSVAPNADLTLDEATISLFFEADTVSGVRGILSKDANGLDGGDHLRARIENGDLVVRFQNEQGDDVDLVVDDIEADQLYHLALSFGDDGAQVYLDGELVASDAGMDMDWIDNAQYLHLGGDGSAQSSGSKAVSNVFDGTLSDIAIYDQQLNANQIAQIMEGA
ncbi:Ig-like domain-containing protein [Actibacterium sp. 188UL27-1]|uniref:Ig-like domain-containing protein n=1 Tax=Actibacterium sp. 188UL27-1 TaxID=2786961 RepID=UPI001EF57984|nr:Ig-like domain-containing protein [Actibacterium sp. 188UL27-1]